jgi:uroporphyrinogen-III synthase
MNAAAHTLLWFRPLSPLNYVLPMPLANQPWASTRHIAMDILQACTISAADNAVLNASPTWLLSSPTAAYLATTIGKPTSIAVMGTPTQTAWREAGGAEPAQWLVSPTGESMGLESVLRQHPNICVLRGKQGRNELIEALLGTGVSVSTVAMYEKTQHPRFPNDLNAALGAGLVALYLTSTDQPERVLNAALDKITLLASQIYVSHERIATVARALGFHSVKLNVF